jgi:ATP-dependent DNA helicase RecQ
VVPAQNARADAAFPIFLAMNEEAVRLAAEQLAQKVAGRALSVGEQRACEAELSELRLAWKRNPSAFSSDLLEMLKRIASSLAAGAVAHKESDPALVLKECFGYDAFRPGQRAIIDTVLSGRDCVGVMPTGAGKSITYQIPARILGGVTLVISPLIALMKDQVDAMTEVGVRATYLNSSLSAEERRARVSELRAGRYELLYCAPEGLEASVGRALGEIKLSLIAVDEAHCISHWGHDFRPAYRNLSGMKQRFPQVPVLALTATATPQVTADIVEQLGMRSPARYRGSFFRKNLRLHAYAKGDALGCTAKEAALAVARSRPRQSGIVYCLSRKTVEATAEFLKKHGVRAGHYHAGLDADVRSKVQDAFQNDEIDVVVATIAFGMGIDKSNVRFVVHHDMPRSVEGYYQELGRAGRDGLDSDCVLLYSWSEVKAYDRFADASEDEGQAERTRAQAREVFRMAEARTCRHAQLARYFGEELADCGSSCDVCQNFELLSKKPARATPEERAQARAARKRERDDSVPPAVLDPDLSLFDRLRALRKEIARERGVPPYVVFSDATLLEMASARPKTQAQMLGISGVGPTKLEHYGERFLKALAE